jgi:hypothetical protein
VPRHRFRFGPPSPMTQSDKAHRFCPPNARLLSQCKQNPLHVRQHHRYFRPGRPRCLHDAGNLPEERVCQMQVSRLSVDVLGLCDQRLPGPHPNFLSRLTYLATVYEYGWGRMGGSGGFAGTHSPGVPRLGWRTCSSSTTGRGAGSLCIFACPNPVLPAQLRGIRPYWHMRRAFLGKRMRRRLAVGLIAVVGTRRCGVE